MRRDTIFYQLFRQSPTLLFDLIANPPIDPDGYIFDSIEVKETSFRIDGVFMPPDPAGIVYFCEVQFQPDELLYERMISENSIYVYRHREEFSDWEAVVIYPSRSIEQSRLQVVREMLASGRITRVYLDELGAVESLPTGLGLMVLTTLEGDEAKAEARRLVKQAQNSKDIINLVSTIVLYKFNTLTRDEVDAMLGIELQQTRVYQEAKAEGEIIGEVRGEARGEARGLERGRTEGEQSLVLKLLSRKLGKIEPLIIARINSLSIDKIECLAEDLLDFNQMSDLSAWLDIHQ